MKGREKKVYFSIHGSRGRKRGVKEKWRRRRSMGRKRRWRRWEVGDEVEGGEGEGGG